MLLYLLLLFSVLERYYRPKLERQFPLKRRKIVAKNRPGTNPTLEQANDHVKGKKILAVFLVSKDR